MKKLITILAAFLLATATFAQTKNTIAVPAPKAVNIGDDSNWIPLFIQGVITANFQQYSGMNVVDRQNADMVKAEQRLSENAAYDEKSAIELGKLTSARLIITGSIMAKSNAYALTFSITDAETGETKATSSIPNCLTSALEDGTAANQVSYDLMKGYGIKLSSEAQSKLTQKASVMSGEAAAQASLAKGIVAEQNGTNIEALTYYIQARKSDKKLGEATSRMANMTTVVTSGNYGANAKNLMKLRNDWDKLLHEATELIASNPPEFELRYFSDIEAKEMTEKDYENGTMTFTVGSPYLKEITGSENDKIVTELLDGLHKIEQSKNWGEKINGFPWSYANETNGDNWLKQAASPFPSYYDSDYTWEKEKEKNGKDKMYSFTVSLLDGKKKVIAKKDINFILAFYGQRFMGFDYLSDNRNYYKSPSESYYFNSSYITFKDIPVNDVDTDRLYIQVENIGDKKISILPVPDGVLSCKQAIAVLKSGNHSGTVRVGGEIGYLRDISGAIIQSEGKKNLFFLDLSEAHIAYISGYAFHNCESLETIVLPSSIREIAYEAFDGFGSYMHPKKIHFCGTSNHWSLIFPRKGLSKDIRVSFDYKPKEEADRLAKYIAHPEKGVPVENVPDVIKSLKTDATVKVVGEIGGSDRSIRSAIRTSKVKIHLDLSSVDINDFGFGESTSFNDCRQLSGITIPVSVKRIAANAFGNTSLEIVNYCGSREQWSKIYIYDATLKKAKINYDYKGE